MNLAAAQLPAPQVRAGFADAAGTITSVSVVEKRFAALLCSQTPAVQAPAVQDPAATRCSGAADPPVPAGDEAATLDPLPIQNSPEGEARGSESIAIPIERAWTPANSGAVPSNAGCGQTELRRLEQPGGSSNDAGSGGVTDAIGKMGRVTGRVDASDEPEIRGEAVALSKPPGSNESAEESTPRVPGNTEPEASNPFSHPVVRPDGEAVISGTAGTAHGTTRTADSANETIASSCERSPRPALGCRAPLPNAWTVPPKEGKENVAGGAAAPHLVTKIEKRHSVAIAHARTANAVSQRPVAIDSATTAAAMQAIPALTADSDSGLENLTADRSSPVGTGLRARIVAVKEPSLAGGKKIPASDAALDFLQPDDCATESALPSHRLIREQSAPSEKVDRRVRVAFPNATQSPIDHPPLVSGAGLPARGSGSEMAAASLPSVPLEHAVHGTATLTAAHFSPAHFNPNTTFDHMDAAASLPVVERMPHRLAVGIHNTGLGWVEIHTSSTGGQVSAILASGSSESHSTITAQLPTVREFLAGEHVRIDHLASEKFSSFQGGQGDSSGSHSQSADRRLPRNMEPHSNAAPGPEPEWERLSYISVRV